MISIATNDELKMDYIATKIANNEFYCKVMNELKSAASQGKKMTNKFEWDKIDKPFDAEEFYDLFVNGLGFTILIEKFRKPTLNYFKVARMDSSGFYLYIDL